MWTDRATSSTISKRNRNWTYLQSYTIQISTSDSALLPLFSAFFLITEAEAMSLSFIPLSQVEFTFQFYKEHELNASVFKRKALLSVCSSLYT